MSSATTIDPGKTDRYEIFSIGRLMQEITGASYGTGQRSSKKSALPRSGLRAPCAARAGIAAEVTLDDRLTIEPPELEFDGDKGSAARNSGSPEP